MHVYAYVLLGSRDLEIVDLLKKIEENTGKDNMEMEGLENQHDFSNIHV